LAVRAFAKGNLPGKIIQEPLEVLQWIPASPTAALGPGLVLSIFERHFDSVSQLDLENPFKKRISQNISLNDSPRAEQYGLLYNGFIRIPEDGIYTFTLQSDDGSALWLDGIKRIDLDGAHGGLEKSANLALRKGYHTLRVPYFQDKGGSVLSLRFGKFGQQEVSVPDKLLFHRP
jgi:hypothetical protein